MANINDFKATLKGGGARANQFSVNMPFPGYAAVGGAAGTHPVEGPAWRSGLDVPGQLSA